MGQTTAVITLLSWFPLLTAWNEREQGSHMKRRHSREKGILKAELAHTGRLYQSWTLRFNQYLIIPYFLMQNKGGKNSHLTWNVLLVSAVIHICFTDMVIRFCSRMKDSTDQHLIPNFSFYIDLFCWSCKFYKGKLFCFFCPTVLG